MALTIKTDVIILGGGISGLSTAYFLRRNGLNVRVLEKQERAGGSISTYLRDGFLIDRGPNSTLDTTPILHLLFRDLQIEDEVEYANEKASNRYIVRNGKLQKLPMNPLAFFASGLFSVRAKLGLLRELFVKPADPGQDESLAEFVVRRLGREFLDYAIDPFVSGVYAGVPEALSVRSAFPKLWELEQSYGSLIKGALLGARKRRKRAEASKQKARLLSFRKGMQTLTDALSAHLKEDLHLGVSVQKILPTAEGYEIHARTKHEMAKFCARRLVFAIPAHTLAELPVGFDFPIREALRRIPYPPVTMVFFGYNGNPSPRPLDGFGFLVPRAERRQILGTIWSSSIFSGRAPVGGAAFTTFVGGTRQPEIALLPDERLREIVLKELKDLLGVTQKPDVVEIARWEKAIPQYNVGHGEVVRAIEAFEDNHPEIFVSGNFRGGISVSDCIKNAFELSRKLVPEFQQKYAFEPLEVEGDAPPSGNGKLEEKEVEVVRKS